ncbi:MAG: helix-turn-helix transcriptional regulator [Polyangia bacterium]
MGARTLDAEDVIADVGRRVAELRAQKGLTQQALAEELGLSWKYLQQVELGLENLTLKSLVRLSNALGVTPVDLFSAPVSRKRRPGRPRKRPTSG